MRSTLVLPFLLSAANAQLNTLAVAAVSNPAYFLDSAF